MSQVHNNFKLFKANITLNPYKGVANLLKKIEAWVSNEHVGAKSIGITYKGVTVIASLGYDNVISNNYSILLSNVKLEGKNIEKAMEAEAKKIKNIMCHELIMIDGDLHVIFMSKVN